MQSGRTVSCYVTAINSVSQGRSPINVFSIPQFHNTHHDQRLQTANLWNSLLKLFGAEKGCISRVYFVSSTKKLVVATIRLMISGYWFIGVFLSSDIDPF